MNIFFWWALFSGLVMLLLPLRMLSFRKHIRLLRDFPPPPERPAWPKVSIIVPACNEAGSIGPAARTLLEMDYPNLELIIVDDRSNDGTGEIIRGLAARDKRVTPVSVTSLPPGWLGKLHALHKGVQAAAGEWLLFTDADVHFRAQSLRKAIQRCDSKKLGFLSIIPSFLEKSFPLRVMVSQFMHFGSLTTDPRMISDPKSKACVGTGAFNLCSREAYLQSGGMEWLKMEVIDDGGLAYAMKLARVKSEALSGVGEIELEWYPSLWGFVKGLEKNGFSLMGYSFPFVLALHAAVFFHFFGYTVAPILSGSVPVMIFVWSAMSFYLAVSAYVIRKVIDVNPLNVLFFPLSFLLFPLVILRSAIICLRQGGIYWRGTFYPLAELRAQQRVKILEMIMHPKIP